MEPLDKLIPLAILGAVGAFLVFLVRRAIRQESAASSAEVPAVVEPIQVEALAVVVTPQPVAVEAEVKPNEVIVESIVRKRRLKKALLPLVAAPPQTPIVTVLELLKQKDSLAAAFLLHEILAPPVSKRN